MTLTLQAINRYPVKSCRGESMQQVGVEPWGLAGDRRWMIVDDEGMVVTAREHPRLVLVRPQLQPDGALELRGPELPPLHVDVPSAERRVPVNVWRHAMRAALAAEDANAWFSKVAEQPVRLVYLDDPTQRHANPAFGNVDDVVSFADGYPIHVTSTASLTAVNDAIAEGPHAAEAPLPMTRFRPNVVVDGDLRPWEEDGWRRVRIGDALFRCVKGCDRCVLTLVDPETARKGKEPIYTLAQHRRFDGATWFGMDLITDTPGAVIKVGDAVEILESVPAPNGPPR